MPPYTRRSSLPSTADPSLLSVADDGSTTAPGQTPDSGAQRVQFRPVRPSQPSSIGLRRRRPSTQRLSSVAEQQNAPQPDGESVVDQQPYDEEDVLHSERRRSHSAPQRPTFDTSGMPMTRMPSIAEGAQGAGTGPVAGASNATRRSRRRSYVQQPEHHEYSSKMVDLLDVVDPEVATLSSITNIQNSLFIPDLGRFLKRRPTYELDRTSDESLPYLPEETASDTDTERREDAGDVRPSVATSRRPSLRSIVVPDYYAVLPHGVTLDGWTDEEVSELNDHVRHMMHSRRSKFKRSMRAFGKYVSTPLGFFVTLYATLITLFGLAWVLFLIGWIYVGERQPYAINVIDNVLVALFAIMGDGLAPFRIVDTYHMMFIAHYHRLSWKIRRRNALPKLQNKNDLPGDLPPPAIVDLEAAREQKEWEFSVLTPKQQDRLVHHQTKFAKSHTFYKPHETETHFAFPLNLLIVIVVLLDLHSCFQISLGACTWSINYKVRPMALTATILSCSITVNITAGILISIGGRRTRKKDVAERMFRQELTAEALHRMRDESGNEQARLRRIDEALEEAGETKEDKEAKEGRGIRKSLDIFRGRHSEDQPRSSVEKVLSPGKKPANKVGRFQAVVPEEEGGSIREEPRAANPIRGGTIYPV